MAGTSSLVSDYLSFQMCVCVLLTGLVRPSLAGKVAFFPSPPTCTSLVTGKVHWDAFMLKKHQLQVTKLSAITHSYLSLLHVLLFGGLSKLQQAGLCLVFKALATTSSPLRVGSIFPSQGKPQKYQKMVIAPLLFQAPHC